jgi:uncharacterized protein (DUF305 family)
MTNNVDAVTTDGEERVRMAYVSRQVIYLVIVLWLILAGVIGYWIGSNRTVTPSDNSAEAGFARDMIVHHANAVTMAIMLRDHTDDDDMRQIALDIMLTQQAQIGQMQGWLQVWGLPIAPGGPQMAWMGMPTEDLMPGMATEEDLEALSALEGVDADILFLNLMIPHHQAGVDMAEAVLQRTDRPEVVTLAQAIVTAQQNEITLMRDLLEQKGAESSEEIDSMEEMDHEG